MHHLLLHCEYFKLLLIHKHIDIKYLTWNKSLLRYQLVHFVHKNVNLHKRSHFITLRQLRFSSKKVFRKIFYDVSKKFRSQPESRPAARLRRIWRRGRLTSRTNLSRVKIMVKGKKESELVFARNDGVTVTFHSDRDRRRFNRRADSFARVRTQFKRIFIGVVQTRPASPIENNGVPRAFISLSRSTLSFIAFAAAFIVGLPLSRVSIVGIAGVRRQEQGKQTQRARKILWCVKLKVWKL